jgi:hypothetical protein
MAIWLCPAMSSCLRSLEPAKKPENQYRPATVTESLIHEMYELGINLVFWADKTAVV